MVCNSVLSRDLVKEAIGAEEYEAEERRQFEEANVHKVADGAL